jgi:hypothetical protein
MNTEMCIEHLETLAKKYNRDYSYLFILWAASACVNFVKFENVIIREHNL